MEIPKNYIKYIEFYIGTIDRSDNHIERLQNLLEDYISPTISIRNYTIKFTLIKPLDEVILNKLSKCEEIDCFEVIRYVPYTRDENIDDLIEDTYGKLYGIEYLKYLIQFMPEKPILEKLSIVKFMLNIPNEIMELDKLLQKSNIEKYFNDIPNNYFTYKFFEEYLMGDYDDIYETKINDNIITTRYIKLPYYFTDKRSIKGIIKENSEYIRAIKVGNKECK